MTARFRRIRDVETLDSRFHLLSCSWAVERRFFLSFFFPSAWSMDNSFEALDVSRLNSSLLRIDIGIASFIAIFQLLGKQCLCHIAATHWLTDVLGVSTLAGFLTHRVRLEDFKSPQHLRQISLPRLFLVLLFATA